MPPCIISQQCFWLTSLMAQCSLYDMYCLKGRSALLFSSDLVPKLLKHRGFSSIYRKKSTVVSLCQCWCVCGGVTVLSFHIAHSNMTFCVIRENVVLYHVVRQIKRAINTSADVNFLWLGLSLKSPAISLSALCVWSINHIVKDSCGHRGSSVAVSWDTNGPAVVELAASEPLAWLKTPVHLCTVNYYFA